MSKQLNYSRITLLVSLFLLIFWILYGNYGVWYGRNQWNNFEFNEKVTVEDLQYIYSKDQWLTFISFKLNNNLPNNEAVIKFWEENGKTPISHLTNEASIELVKEVFPNAKDNLRVTLFYQYVAKKADFFTSILMIYICLMIILPKKSRILLTYALFNFIYWLAISTIGAILPILILNLLLFTSCIIQEIKFLQKIKFFNNFNKLCTKTLWKWNLPKDFIIINSPCFKLFVEGSILLIVSCFMLFSPNIGVLLNIPAILISFIMISEVNNRINSNNNLNN